MIIKHLWQFHNYGKKYERQITYNNKMNPENNEKCNNTN